MVKMPPDQKSRDRFISELEKNFSVIAAAGAGKTRAITDRIVQIALASNAREILPTLVVVTFTNRAADEMQRRARQKILEQRVSLEVLGAFNRVFFGTIHSFCLKLLTNHGHHLGLPATLELLKDDDELWHQFVQRETRIGHSLTIKNRETLLRHVQVRQLMELGRGGQTDAIVADVPGEYPDLDFSAVYSYPGKGKKSPNILDSQEALRRWEQRWRNGSDFLRWPVRSVTTGGLITLWRETFAPLRRWVSACALCVAAEVQRDYREFPSRTRRPDLCRPDRAGRRAICSIPKRRAAFVTESIRCDSGRSAGHRSRAIFRAARNYATALRRRALDEDVRRSAAPGALLHGRRFSTIDLRDRADLAHYRRVHDALVESGGGETLTFSVTFRLDQTTARFRERDFRQNPAWWRRAGEVRRAAIAPKGFARAR